MNVDCKPKLKRGMNSNALKKTLELHVRFLKGEDGGVPADLGGANLSWADLSWADLRGAYLSWANLRETNIHGADLRGANLSGANLDRVTSIPRVEVSWSDYGERGRKLIAILVGDEVKYFCGCFAGTLQELRDYISDGKDEYKTSRTIAVDFCEARIKEMMVKRKE